MCFVKRKKWDSFRHCLFDVEVSFFGVLTIGLSFVASFVTSKLIQTAGLVFGVLGSPLGGVFIMGLYVPFCNSPVRTIDVQEAQLPQRNSASWGYPPVKTA